LRYRRGSRLRIAAHQLSRRPRSSPEIHDTVKLLRKPTAFTRKLDSRS
jgi:hypothetical protein